MIKSILISLLLVSPSISVYRPMSKSEIDFGKDVCHYTRIQDNQNIEYVKPCKKGKVCKIHQFYSTNNDYKIYTCQNKYLSDDEELKIKTLGEKCSYDEECDSGLNCLSGTCTLEKNDQCYKDQYCPSGLVPLISGSNCICKESSLYQNTDKCAFYNGTSYIPSSYKFKPAYGTVCGKVSFQDITASVTNPTNGQSYDYTFKVLKDISTAKIGSLEEGTYVYDVRACKSGFGIKYYPDNNLEEPDNHYTSAHQYYRCVKVKEINMIGDSCVIKYSLDNTENILNMNKISTSSQCTYLKTKLEMFEEYLNDKSKCDNEINYDEPFTCGDDKLRKYWYFYLNPSYYDLYKDKTQVIDYLLQDYYNSLSYLIINLKHLIILLILLLF